MNAILIVIILAAVGYILFQGIGGGSTVNTTASALTMSIAQAIAVAEGFYISGSRPQKDHNPGDMTQDLIGRGVGMDGAFIVYGSDADGWSNLYAQVNDWLGGSSAHATADSTITQISQFYTTDDPPGAQVNWANTVAGQLGVSPDTSIGSIT